MAHVQATRLIIPWSAGRGGSQTDLRQVQYCTEQLVIFSSPDAAGIVKFKIPEIEILWTDGASR